MKIVIKTLSLLLLLPGVCLAQSFGDDTAQSAKQPSSIMDNPRNVGVQKIPAVTDNKDDTPKLKSADEFFIPNDVAQPNRPTLDGVKRGRASMIPVAVEGDVQKGQDDKFIFLFYKDFSVNKSLTGRVMCDVTFAVLTTIDREINNISFKLKWPDMLTTLSFDDVAPNQETIYKYTLLGDGCYSMDKIPNIIVNRCRVKGMTQEQCASKIRWIKKA